MRLDCVSKTTKLSVQRIKLVRGGDGEEGRKRRREEEREGRGGRKIRYKDGGTKFGREGDLGREGGG